MHQQIDGDASKDDGDGMPFDALACVDEMHAHAPHAARYDSYTHHDRYTHTCDACYRRRTSHAMCHTHTLDARYHSATLNAIYQTPALIAGHGI